MQFEACYQEGKKFMKDRTLALSPYQASMYFFVAGQFADMKEALKRAIKRGVGPKASIEQEIRFLNPRVRWAVIEVLLVDHDFKKLDKAERTPAWKAQLAKEIHEKAPDLSPDAVRAAVSYVCGNYNSSFRKAIELAGIEELKAWQRST